MIFYRDYVTPKVISFDLDDTLYDNAPVILYAENYIKEILGCRYLGGMPLDENLYYTTKKRILTLLPELVHDVSLVRYFVYEELLKQYGWGKYFAREKAAEMVDAFIKVRSRLPVSQNIVSFLQKIRKHYHVVAVSNGNADIDMTILKNNFDLVLHPTIDFHSKPKSDLFDYVSYFYKVPHNKILHVGDNTITDVFGTVNSGCQACWYTEYIRDFDEIKVLPHVEVSSLSDLSALLLK